MVENNIFQTKVNLKVLKINKKKNFSEYVVNLPLTLFYKLKQKITYYAYAQKNASICTYYKPKTNNKPHSV